MKLIRNFLQITICLILILVSLLFITTLLINNTFLSERFYEGMIYKTEFMPSIYQAVKNELIQNINDDSDKNEMQEILTSSIEKTINEEWFKENTFLAIKDALNIIKGNQQEFTLVIETDNFMANFKKEIENKVDELPEEEKKQLEKDGFNIDAIIEDIDIPDQIVLSEFIDVEEITTNFKPQINIAQQVYKYLNIIFFVIFALLLGLSILISKLTKGLKWFGITGAVIGIIYLLGLFVAQEVLINIIIQTEQIAIFNNYLIVDIMSYSFNKMFIFLGIFIICFISFIALSFILKNKFKKTEN